MTHEEQAVLVALSDGGRKTLAELQTSTQLPLVRVREAIIALQSEGLVDQQPNPIERWNQTWSLKVSR